MPRAPPVGAPTSAGWLARLDQQPAGRAFLVRTAQAEVQAVGTRFSVGILDDGQTQVHFHEGKLARLSHQPPIGYDSSASP